MKIAIVTGIWQRPEVFRMFAQGVKVLQENSPHEIKCFVSGSEGETSKQLVESFGFSYVEIPNEPLAKKMNASVLLAKDYDPDFILCVGSDDIISPGLLGAYERYMRSKIDFIGVTDFYFWDYAKNRASYWGGYKEAWRRGHTAGAGRMISKRLMDIWKWQPWNNEHNRILDTSIQEKLSKTPHTSAIFSMKAQGVFGLDIKSDTNMTPFKLWDNTELIHPEIIHQQFPYLKSLAKVDPIKKRFLLFYADDIYANMGMNDFKDGCDSISECHEHIVKFGLTAKDFKYHIFDVQKREIIQCNIGETTTNEISNKLV